jgi:hypothetical protein
MIVLFGLSSVLVVFTGTRAISVGFFLTMIIVLFFRNGICFYKLFMFFILSIVATVLLATYFTSFEQIELVSRFGGIFSGDLESDSSTRFRMYILQEVFNNFETEFMLFGHGPGSFPIWFSEKTLLDNVAPHVEILWLFFEFGLVGLFAYFSIIYLSYKAVKINFTKKSISFFEFMVVTIDLVSHMLWFQFANPFYFYQFGLMFFCVLGVYTSINTHTHSMTFINLSKRVNEFFTVS